MARGWESKAIESQQDDARRDGGAAGPREAAATDRRRTLQLARAALANQLAQIPEGPRRRSLESALEALDPSFERSPRSSSHRVDTACCASSPAVVDGRVNGPGVPGRRQRSRPPAPSASG